MSESKASRSRASSSAAAAGSDRAAVNALRSNGAARDGGHGLPGPSRGSGHPLPTTDVVVISWHGFGDRARHIAQQLNGLPGVRLRVIYSNATETPERGAGSWLQVPNEHYFGAKFSAALPDFDDDVLMIVQADALCEDWRGMVQRCQLRFAQRPRLGLWAPRIAYTPWLPKRVDIRLLPGENMTEVAHTDAIVLAMSREVVQRLRDLDYRENNIGWGIDWIAICHCYTRGLAVLREDELAIAHPPSRGYDSRQATAQWLAFMQQMTEAEQAMFEILKRYTAEKRTGLWSKLMLSVIKRRSSRDAACIARLSLLEPVVQWRNEGRV